MVCGSPSGPPRCCRYGPASARRAADNNCNHPVLSSRAALPRNCPAEELQHLYSAMTQTMCCMLALPFYWCGVRRLMFALLSKS